METKEGPESGIGGLLERWNSDLDRLTWAEASTVTKPWILVEAAVARALLKSYRAFNRALSYFHGAI